MKELHIIVNEDAVKKYHRKLKDQSVISLTSLYDSEFRQEGFELKKRGTFEIKEIQPIPKKGEPDYRFNWNAPIAVTKNALYIAGQFLFRSIDKGESWQKISPDLTTNDPKKQKQKLQI